MYETAKSTCMRRAGVGKQIQTLDTEVVPVIFWGRWRVGGKEGGGGNGACAWAGQPHAHV